MFPTSGPDLVSRKHAKIFLSLYRRCVPIFVHADSLAHPAPRSGSSIRNEEGPRSNDGNRLGVNEVDLRRPVGLQSGG